MPYSGPGDRTLPEAVRKLPKWLRNIWVGAFNAVMEQDNDESKAFPIAWAAVRRASDKKGKKMMDELTAEGQSSTTAAESAKKKEKAIEIRDWEDAIEQAWEDEFGGGEAEAMGMAPSGPELEAVYDTHVIVSEGEQLYKAPYTAEWVTAADGETQSIAGVTFAPRAEWLPVVRTFVALKLFREPDERLRWLAVSSGGFEDREGEVVSTAYLEDAIARADKSGDRGDLRVYHIPGTRIGSCDYQALADGFLLESGLFDETPAGRAGAEYVQAHPDTRLSIGFVYRHRTADGVYMPPGMILERSILPPDAAAFPWSGITLTELADMTTMTESKQKALEEILGPDIAGEVLTNLEGNAKSLQDAGVRFKELEPEEGTAKDAESAEQAAEKAVTELEAAPVLAEATVTPAEPLVEEFEMSDEALDQIAAKLYERFEGLVTKSIVPLGDQMAALRTVIQEMGADVARLTEAEDVRIAEKAAELPRATVRRILRPTQREKALETEPEQPQGAAVALTDIGIQTLYGSSGR